MGVLSRYEGSSAPAQISGAAGFAAGGRSVDEGDWSGEVLSFQSLARHVPDGEEIASMARVCPGALRRGSPPRYVRRRVGWWADRERIVTALSEQRLLPQPDGRFRATGEWSTPRLEEFRPVGVPARRGRRRTPRLDLRQRRQDCRLRRRQVPGRPVAGRLLPEPVRRSIAARIPSPVVFEAEAVRHSPARGRPRHTVKVLKLGDTAALVVVATRQAGAVTWQVELVVHELPPRHRPLST